MKRIHTIMLTTTFAIAAGNPVFAEGPRGSVGLGTGLDAGASIRAVPALPARDPEHRATPAVPGNPVAQEKIGQRRPPRSDIPAPAHGRIELDADVGVEAHAGANKTRRDHGS